MPFAGFKTLAFFLFFLAESSCVRLESYNIGVVEEHKPVIFSLISPDLDTIGVWVSKTILGNDTIPLYSKNEVLRSSLTEKDAEVYISGNNTRMRLIYNEKREQFVVSTDSFPIQKGGKYALEVKLATGEVAKSSTIIPDGECIIDDFNYAPRFERDETALVETIYDIELKWSGTIARNAKFMLYDYCFWGFSFGSKIRRGKAVFPEKSEDGTYSYQMKTKICHLQKDNFS